MGGAEKIEKGHAPAHCDGPNKAEGEPLNFVENRHIDGVYQGDECFCSALKARNTCANQNAAKYDYGETPNVEPDFPKIAHASSKPFCRRSLY
jgi:hypothetical protein